MTSIQSTVADEVARLVAQRAAYRDALLAAALVHQRFDMLDRLFTIDRPDAPPAVASSLVPGRMIA